MRAAASPKMAIVRGVEGEVWRDGFLSWIPSHAGSCMFVE